jgi:hypothetical protein
MLLDSSFQFKNKMSANFQFDEMTNGLNSVSGAIMQLSMIVKDMQSMVTQIVQYLYDRSKEEHLKREWQSATQGLDFLLMIAFLISNCIVTAAFIITGYMNQEI